MYLNLLSDTLKTHSTKAIIMFSGLCSIITISNSAVYRRQRPNSHKMSLNTGKHDRKVHPD